MPVGRSGLLQRAVRERGQPGCEQLLLQWTVAGLLPGGCERELRRLLLTNVVDLTSIDYYVVCCCDYHQPAGSALPLLYHYLLISDWS